MSECGTERGGKRNRGGKEREREGEGERGRVR